MHVYASTCICVCTNQQLRSILTVHVYAGYYIILLALYYNIICRILVRSIPQLENRRKDADIQWHVQHEMQREMSRKSVVVSI